MSRLLKLIRQSEDEIPFSVRFKAWWDGVAPDALVREDPKPDDGEATFIHVADDDDEPDDGRNWPVHRLAIAQHLWDKGCSLPGGVDYTLQLINPFGVNPSMSILDLATGLGGGTRAIAKEFDVWITGMDVDAELAAAAHAYSVQKGLEKRVPITPVDPTNFSLPEGKFDCILMRESLNVYPDKIGALKTIKEALKADGQFIMTDIVLADNDSETEDFKAWQERTTVSPRPWTLAKFKSALHEQAFVMHIFEDETDIYRQMIVSAWDKFVSRLRKEDMTRRFINALMHEAEIWVYLVRAMESGALRYVRMHVAKPKMKLI